MAPQTIVLDAPEHNYSVDEMRRQYLKVDGNPPKPSEKTVYHYTSLDVLNEMCKETGDLLCTHFMSLNDNQEFFLGIDTVLEKLSSVFSSSERKMQNLDLFQKNAPRMIVDHLRKESLVPWITSFSADPDSLYQWVAYTDRKQGGVAIGFDLPTLQGKSKTVRSNPVLKGKISCLPERCLYADDAKISSHIRNAFSTAFSMLGNKRWPDKVRDMYLLAAVYVCASTIKNPSFSQEKEFRLIMIPTLKEVTRRYKFIGGKPRIATEFFGKNRELAKAISSVVISPHGDHAKLVSAVNLLRQQHGLKFQIYKSRSSYNGR